MSRWPMGTSGATQFFGEAVILIVAALVGVLALQSAAALLEQRRLIALMFVRRVDHVRTRDRDNV